MSQKINKNIILTGFMATGKTTIGQLIAKELCLKFIDTDEEIVSRQGLSIPDIFSHFGEHAFREMETEIADELAGREGLVISTGGRMMLDPTNVDLLTKTGHVFCLTATADEILDRVAKDGGTRPLLAVPDPKGKILELLEERKKGYQRFEKVSTSNRKPAEIAQDVIKLFKTTRSKPLP